MQKTPPHRLGCVHKRVGGTLPAHHLAGAHKRGVTYSWRRAPHYSSRRVPPHLIPIYRARPGIGCSL